MSDAGRRARDELIALRCRLGEPGAFADLVRELESPLLYYTTKILRDENAALDVLQHVWITAFRKLRRLEDPAAMRAWLYRIAHGLAIDRLRQDRSQKRTERDRAEASPPAGAAPSFNREDAAALHHALDELDVNQREALVLHFLEGWSVGEIAAVLGCPEGTVKSRIHYGKNALREILERGGYGHT
jgi:RNA polymerase sigma-70 factor, ECF subfamily